MEKYITIPVHKLELLKPEGFIRRFQQNSRISRTYKEAYQQTEKEHMLYFQSRKYSNYNSFRNCLTRIIKK